MHVLFPKRLWVLVLIFVTQLSYAQSGQGTSRRAQTDTLRVFLIGNSFSQNAARYLPQLAAQGGHPLVIGRAELGGCSLERHWTHAAAFEANPNDPNGSPYKDKSLRQLLSEGTWDLITIQQNSMNSPDPGTYQPYARQLYDYVKAIQPQAEVVLHQTWAYRSDADGYGQVSPGTFAQSERDMWEKSRAAYHATAQNLGVRVIPVGDAFWAVSSDPAWGYRQDPNYDFKAPKYPSLPNQANSLHVGYRWTNDQKWGFDSHHANEAGCYLGSLVWYTFLFGDSPQKLTFVPEPVPAVLAAQLKKVAEQTVSQVRK
ncbi:DUF4886 domain-containing protein [Rhabdobacter roseus]|uniref:DUF4886 domain-containing protein n=1 Tax=Rhabdobacter roseus TaxID=1655419 RepID=A0A840U3K3_9BACT|nr:DUF4886 domain-containing protein [Rhabdobacter roseus]MBB5286419.1 hypothetical protein [Rhabdobacter roseus]